MQMIEELQAYRAYEAERKLAQKINKMTHSLLYFLEINRHDSGLVGLIGKEGDRTNEDAVKSWVTVKLCCPSCMYEKSARTLANELYKVLTRLSDDMFH